MNILVGNKQYMKFIKLICVFYWLTSGLHETDSNYGVYTFFALISVMGIVKESCSDIFKSNRDKWLVQIISGLISFVVFLANYHLFFNFIEVSMMLVTGYVTAKMALGFLYTIIIDKRFKEREGINEIKPSAVFLISMSVIVIIDVLYLFLCDYPGNLSFDSISQIKQVLGIDGYTNHHPFWHTIIIKCCMTLGFRVFGEINAAIAVYSVFQIVFMATCFASTIVTLYQMRVPHKYLVILLGFYTFVPYYIVYSTTMWKDVVFGGAVLLFVVSFARVLLCVGQKKWLNYTILFFSGMASCLFRNNGWIAFVLMTFLMVLVFRTKYLKLYFLLGVILISSHILKGPVLDGLEIPPSGIQESLSIPCQQIARVIVDGEPITDEQRELLNAVIDVERVPELYKCWLSDPIKTSINTEHLSNHKAEYLMLWIEMGLEHPWTYVKAWVDQTKGYWNGAYDYWINEYGVYINELDVRRTIASESVSSTFLAYAQSFEYDRLFSIVRGIGVNIWLVFLLGVMNFMRGDVKKMFLTVPVLCIVLTLWIATPLWSEFRYAYPVFTCAPFLTALLFTSAETEEDMKMV